MGKPYTIAELGSNPAPFTRKRLDQFLRHAHLAGADAVKVQLFRAIHFPSEEQDAKRQLEFPREQLEWFLDRARFYRLQAGASVFDKDAIDLCNRLGTNFIKLATREQSNWALREYSQNFKGTIFRSVDFTALHSSRTRLPREVTLGCVPQYPTILNAKFLSTMHAKIKDQEFLPEPWGWSSHTQGHRDVEMAAVLGAQAIEKHFRVSKSDPEAEWSLDYQQWRIMERMLQNVS
jgi:sialic acid synthase SpsE